MCHFYILYSETLDRHYFGHTCDTLDGRLREHLYDHVGFTGRAKDWKLVYHEEFTTRTAAYARERQVKAWNKRNKD